MSSVSILKHVDSEVAAAIHGVMMRAYRVEADLLGLLDFFPLHRTTEQISASNTIFLGITLSGTLAAVAEIETEETQRIHISSLVVLPDHFRRGLATALLQHIVERSGHGDISVSTAARNRPALNLYALHGFHEHRHWATHDGISMVTLVRRPS